MYSLCIGLPYLQLPLISLKILALFIPHIRQIFYPMIYRYLSLATIWQILLIYVHISCKNVLNFITTGLFSGDNANK